MTHSLSPTTLWIKRESGIPSLQVKPPDAAARSAGCCTLQKRGRRDRVNPRRSWHHEQGWAGLCQEESPVGILQRANTNIDTLDCRSSPYVTAAPQTPGPGAAVGASSRTPGSRAP